MDSHEIAEKISLIEKRLGTIERHLNIPSSLTKEAPAPKPDGSSLDASPVHMRPATQQKPPEKGEGNWLGLIAVVCFVLAAGFIIKLSIESGWLTPIRQIGIATLLGFSLIGAGLSFIKADREYASFLPSAGVITLYLTTFAAHRYYALIPFDTALGATALTSALCIWLYTKIKHDIYPLTATVGAYLSPIVLGIHTETTFSLYYYLCCSIAFATISIWVQSRTLILVSAYLALLTTALTGFELGQNGLISCFLALHFFALSVGTYLYSMQTRTALGEKEAWCFLPVLLTFYALEYHFISLAHPGLAPWISLGFAGLIIGLYLSSKRYFPDKIGGQALMLSFVSIVCFHSVYLKLLPDDFKPWLFSIILFGYGLLPSRLLNRKNKTLVAPTMALLAIVGLEYMAIISDLFSNKGLSFIPVSAAALFSLWFVIVRSDDVTGRSYGRVLLSAGHLLAIMGLYRLTTDIGSLAVSASWLLYAVSILSFSFMRKDEIMAKSAMFVLTFAAAKALLYDAASAPTVVRILCLLLTGVVLYGCGFFMRKTAKWKNTAPHSASTPPSPC